jgi:YMGG-like Gly-zipper
MVLMFGSTVAARGSSMRWAVIGLTLGLCAACSDKEAASRAGGDSSLARDLALANSQSAASPQLQDTATSPAPAPASHAQREDRPAPVRTHTARRPQVEQPPQQSHAAPTPSVQPPPSMPAPAPATIPAAMPARGEIGSGSTFALTNGTKVCTSNQPGDKIVATLNESVTGSNGAVIPSGSTVVLEVASVTPGDNGADPRIALRVKSVVVNDKTYSVAGDVTPLAPLDKTKIADGGTDKTKVVGGAIAGAILGQMIGHNTKGTLIGAAAGAATGAAVGHQNEQYAACLPAGAPLRLTLSSPIMM